jgi:hypothetical protein
MNVTDGSITRSDASLDDFERIAGSSVLRASLRVRQEYDFGSGSKESLSTRNYMFYDPTRDASYWLLPGFNGMIHSTHKLPERPCGDETYAVSVFVYELIDQDTNKDGQLTERDVKQIAISDAAGTRLMRVLKDVQELNSAHLLTDGQALVLYVSSGSTHAARIDVTTGKVINDTVLKPSQDPPVAAR